MIRKNILLPVLLTVLPLIAAAQEHTLDSLRTALKCSAQDSNQVKLLNALSYVLLYSHTDTTIAYANQAKELAEKLNFPRGLASAYLRLGQAYNNLGDYSASQTYLNQGLRVST